MNFVDRALHEVPGLDHTFSTTGKFYTDCGGRTSPDCNHSNYYVPDEAEA